MKREFKVGDRVRVYGNRRLEWSTHGIWTGVVNQIIENGLLAIAPDKKYSNHVGAFVYSQQCRRLIPRKKRREIWINWDPLVYSDVQSKEEELFIHNVCAVNGKISIHPQKGWLRFIEAKEKK